MAKKLEQTVGVTFGQTVHDRVYSYRLHESLVGNVNIGDQLVVQTGHFSGHGLATVTAIPAPVPERATAWAFQKVNTALSKTLPRD